MPSEFRASFGKRARSAFRIERSENVVTLIATFETNALPAALSEQLRNFECTWEAEEDRDWVKETEQAWPARAVGEKLFIAPPWSAELTPNNRLRVIHNPGMASGTGEHPCTQLALQALERVVTHGCTVGDIGTGSGMLAITALRLGARFAVAVDTDQEALLVARENARLNNLQILLAAGSADCLRASCFDVVVANINASVLLALADDLARIVKPGGALILTGFQEYELATMRRAFRACTVFEQDGWSALISIWPASACF